MSVDSRIIREWVRGMNVSVDALVQAMREQADWLEQHHAGRSITSRWVEGKIHGLTAEGRLARGD